MKFSASLLLLLFVTFLVTPTVVSFVEKDCDTSIFYTMTEEEETHKDLKVVFSHDNHHDGIVLPSKSNGKILFENLSRHDNASAVIFSPPPELV